MDCKCVNTDKLRIKSIQNDIVIFEDESRETVTDFVRHYNGLMNYLEKLVADEKKHACKGHCERAF